MSKTVSSSGQADQPEGQITRLLRLSREGDTEAIETLVPMLYGELKKLARSRLKMERAAHTLTPTALVNEFYLRLIENRRLQADCRREFFAIASRTMRRVLVDYAKQRNRAKRGGGRTPVALDRVEFRLSDQEADEILALEEALKRLSELDGRAGQVVELRFFGGLTLQEIGSLMGVSSKTVQRSWTTARAWLKKEIQRK